MKKAWVIGLTAVLAGLAGCQGEKSREEDPEEVLPLPQEEETKEIKEYEIDISEKLSDFQFAIDGQVKKLPFKMEEWKEEGWEFREEEGENFLEAESYAEGKAIYKEEQELLVDVVNLDSEKRELRECYIGGIILEYKENGPICQLPGGITLGKSFLGQVEEVYGVPVDEYQEKEDVYLTYEFGLYKEADFVFDLETETLEKAVLKNYREPENQEEEISREIPKEVELYEKPEDFSENPMDYIVSYDGDFYRIPAPVSRFLENGWEVEREGSDAYVKAGRHGYATLEKNGKSIYAVVRNYGENTVELENTFVTNLSGDFDVTKIPIAAGAQITLGMSREEMKIRLGGTAYEEREEEEGTSYFCYSDETKKNYVKFFVDKELDLVREIEVSNSPQSLIQDPNQETGEGTESSVLTDREE